MIFYHYCSVESFYSIISHGTIRLSDIRKMNDSHEQKWLIRCIIEALSTAGFRRKYYDSFTTEMKEECDSLLNFWEPYFFPACEPELIFCLSESPDLLSQWRAYANDGKGVCIGFDGDCFMDLAEHEGSPIFFDRVQYIKSEDIIDGFIEVFDKKYNAPTAKGKEIFIETINDFLSQKRVAFVKNPAFEEEKEWRLVFDPYKNPNQSVDESGPLAFGDFVISERKFRPSSDNIVLFRELNFQMHKEIIKHIVVGPKCQINPHIDLTDFLWSMGYKTQYNRIIVDKSTATYR